MSRPAHRSWCCHLPWMSQICGWMRAQSEVKTFELKNSVDHCRPIETSRNERQAYSKTKTTISSIQQPLLLHVRKVYQNFCRCEAIFPILTKLNKYSRYSALIAYLIWKMSHWVDPKHPGARLLKGAGVLGDRCVEG